MFLVLNKEKICAYLVSAVTVIMLFFVANMMTTNNTNTIETSSSNTKQLPIYNVQTDENKIAITINCAWNADDIDSILKTLKQNNIKVTFFMVGDWVEKFPEAVKKIYNEGHEIGNHSLTHPHVNNLSLEENIEQIKKCSEKIKAITGNTTTLYRAPYGEYNNTVIEAAKSANHNAIQWNLDSLDYEKLTGEQMWNRIKDKLSKGSIILFHNGTEHTADSLDMIIKNIKSRGFEIVKVSDLIYTDNYTINSNGTQIKDN